MAQGTITGLPPATPAVSVDFGKLGQETLRAVESGQFGTTAGSAATPPPTQQGVSTGAATGSTTAADAPTITPIVDGQNPATSGSPETKYTIEFPNGEKQELTATQINEWRQSGLRLADYTRKTTEVADQRREVQRIMEQLAPMQEDLRWAQQLKQNPQLIIQMAQRMQAQNHQQTTQGQPNAPAFDPNAPMTQAQTLEMAQAIAARLQEMEGKLNESVETRANAIVRSQMEIANYSTAINSTLADAFGKFPILKALPETEDIIRYRVSRMEPKTIQETLKAFSDVSQVVAEEITSKFGATQVASTIAQNQQQMAVGIEPPRVGSPLGLGQEKRDYRANGGRDLDWRKLRTDALTLTQQQ